MLLKCLDERKACCFCCNIYFQILILSSSAKLFIVKLLPLIANVFSSDTIPTNPKLFWFSPKFHLVKIDVFALRKKENCWIGWIEKKVPLTVLIAQLSFTLFYSLSSMLHGGNFPKHFLSFYSRFRVFKLLFPNLDEWVNLAEGMQCQSWFMLLPIQTA